MSRRPRASGGERVCNHVERARDEHGLSRQDLADAVGVHYQTIGYIERGEYSPSLELALRMARFLDTPVEALFALETPDGGPAVGTTPTQRHRSAG